MHINKQLAAQMRHAAKSDPGNEVFRTEYNLNALNASFASQFKRPEPQRASCEDCGE